jgi:hypothetical protein
MEREQLSPIEQHGCRHGMPAVGPSILPIPRVVRRIVCIAGALQREGGVTGIEKLWLKLGYLRSAQCSVDLREWNADWKTYAEHVWATGINGSTSVQVFCYSWGAGHGFLRLAAALAARGIDIECAVLSDPVYHSRLLSFRWLALTRLPKIVVPPTVRQVYWLYQRQNRPCGHAVVAADTQATCVHEGRLDKRRTHQFMDDSPEFHGLCLHVADPDNHDLPARAA